MNKKIIVLLIISLLVVCGCGEKHKNNAVKYLEEKGFNCVDGEDSYYELTQKITMDASICSKEENGVNKKFTIRYDKTDFFVTYVVRKDDAEIKMDENSFAKGSTIVFGKGDNYYGSMFQWIDHNSSHYYVSGAELVETCDPKYEENIRKGCEEAKEYVGLVNESIKEFKELYNKSGVGMNLIDRD